MTVRQLIAALLANCDENFDAEVFLCPNVQAVDAVESCPGNPMYGLQPYITLHSACRYPAGHGQQSLQDAIDLVRVDHREALDRLADQ